MPSFNSDKDYKTAEFAAVSYRKDVPSVMSPAITSPITFDTFVAELKPESELGSNPPPDELDALLEALYRSTDEL